MRRRPAFLTRLAVHAGLIVVTIATLYPVLWVLKMALSPGQAFATDPSPFPSEISFEHFQAVIGTTYEGADGTERWLFGRQLLNSLVIASATAFVGLVLSTTAAYALSRYKFPGKEAGMSAFLVTQMFPGVVMLIPLYLLLDAMNLLESLLGLVFVYATTAVPFSVFTLKGYFDTLPTELEEAAIMDGASRWQTFWQIILPLARPALAVTALFSFMTAWNEFILAATLVSSPQQYTLPIVLQRYVDDFGTQWGSFAAGSIIVSIPVVALFFALQRYFVEGLTAGSVKG